MSKFARMTDVLDLFSDTPSMLSAEEIAERLSVSRPTAFRYARELSSSGFLANFGGRYCLGPRVITLDYRIRVSDPVLRIARDAMRELAAETGCGVILCRMYTHEIINMHHEHGRDDVAIRFDRGRPLPLFRGSASKVVVSQLPTARLKRLYEQHAGEPDTQAIAPDWPGFRQYFAEIRRRGHYVSFEEIDEGVIGIAAPVIAPGLGTVAAISLVTSAQRRALVNIEGIATLVMARAQEIGGRLQELAPDGADAQAAAEPGA